MCSLAGFSGNSEGRDIQAGVVALSHRGPGSSGIFASETHAVELAHTLLSIVGLPLSGQRPMVAHGETHVLVFNGEIHNFLDLRKSLEDHGSVIRGNSDTEVPLEPLVRDGEDVWPHLNGMVAFALLNRRNGSWSSGSVLSNRQPFLPRTIHRARRT